MRARMVSFTVLLFVVACGGGDDPATCVDDDGDGYGVGAACLEVDCDDDDATIHPGAFDFLVDGIDQDCDGGDVCLVDADGDHVSASATATVVSADLDCDDFGEARFGVPTNDCDDQDPDTYPAATEIFGDQIDQSCDGEEVCFVDLDGDGARGTSTVISADPDCADAGEMPASAALDCADTPDADSACGGQSGTMCSPLLASDGCTVPNVDEDCDGSVDEDGDTYFRDADRDGYGAADEIVHACAATAGYAADSGDCDDRDPTAWRSAMRFPDLDADGYGAGDEVLVCEGAVVPLGYAEFAGDCGPLEPSAHPLAGEIPSDGIDQDCGSGDLVPSNTNGVFVATTALGGDDANPGTKESPVATIAHARELADAAGYDHLYLAAGDYPFVYSGVELGQSLHGGYDGTFGARGGGATTLVGTMGPIVRAEPVAIDGLTIDVSDDDGDSIALNVIEGTLTVRNVEFRVDGAFNSAGIWATRARLYVDGATFTIARGIASDGILARSGRTVVTRSRFVVHSATASGSSTSGVSVYPSDAGTGNAPAIVAVVGNTFDVGIEGGESVVDGVFLYGIQTRALVANNTFRLGPAETPWSEGQFAVRAWAAGLPVAVDFVNDVVVATDGPDSAAALYLGSDGAEARAALRHDAIYLVGEGDCPVFTDGICRDAAAIAACEFEGCIASAGNLYVDPGLDAGFSPLATSVCLDAGTPPTYATSLFATDLVGTMRPQGVAIDVGAYEVED